MRVTFTALGSFAGRRQSLQCMSRGAYLLDLGLVPYQEAWDCQRSLAGAVSQGAIPGHGRLPRAPTGRHTRPSQRRGGTARPRGRGGRGRRDRTAAASPPSTGRASSSVTRSSTCSRHGKDVKKYVRDLEEALIRTVGPASASRRRASTASRASGSNARRARSPRSACTSHAG